jgi:hypothetical protein
MLQLTQKKHFRSFFVELMMKTVRKKFEDNDKAYFTFSPFFPVPLSEDFHSSYPYDVMKPREKEDIRRHYYDALYDGLFTPFSTSNGTFLEHIRLAFMYTLLRLASIVVNFITLDWPATIVHCIALPLTIAYWLIGLVTRSIATVIDALFPTDTQDEFYCVKPITAKFELDVKIER